MAAKTAKTKPPPAGPPPVPAPAPVERPAEVLGELPLGQVRPCPFNTRKAFDAADLAGLAESIRTIGLKERLLVRPVGRGGRTPRFEGGRWVDVGHFELADGERRYRALLLINETHVVETVPVAIRVMTDDEVRAVMLASREQSRDLAASELVAGYAELAKDKTAEQVAALVGRPVGHVRSVLRLARLPAWALAAVDRGELPRATAELVARVPGDLARAQFAAEVLLDVRLGDEQSRDLKAVEEYVTADLKRHGGPPEALPYREVRDLLREYQAELKTATFSRKALDLLPGVGSCDDCPRRAGNDPEATAEGVRADMCLDVECFKKKTEAHSARVIAAARETGKPVLPAKECDKVFEKWGAARVAYNSPYLALDDKCHDDRPKNRTYRQLLAKHLGPADVVVGVHPRDGTALELVKKDAAAKLLKEHHQVGKKAAGAGSAGGDDKAERARRLAENKLRREFHREVLRRTADAAWEAFTHSGMPGDGTPTVNTLVRQLALDAIRSTWGTAVEDVASRRGITGRTTELRDGLEKVVKAAGAPAVLALLVELQAAKVLPFGSWSDAPRKALASALGLDRAAIEKEVKARLKDGKAAKGKPAARPAPVAAPAPPPAPGRTPLGEVEGIPDAVLDRLSQKKIDTLNMLVADARAAVGSQMDPDALPPRQLFFQYLTGERVPRNLAATAADAIAEHLARAEAPPAGPDPGNLTGWRRSPVEDLDADPEVFARLHAAGVKTLGDLTARFLAGEQLGLRPDEAESLQDQIEIASAEEPHPIDFSYQGPRCRTCGCTNEDCSGCVEKTGRPCHWVEQDLCSACAPPADPGPGAAAKKKRVKERKASRDELNALKSGKAVG